MNREGDTACIGVNAEPSMAERDCQPWDIPNLWIYGGSVCPTIGRVNPSLTITAMAIAMRSPARIGALAKRCELSATAGV